MPPITAARVRVRARGLATAAAACLVLAGCGGDAEQQLNGATRTPASEVGGVTLPAHRDGRRAATPAAMRAQDGLLLVYFGYTFCPDICPTSLADLGAALDDLTAAERRRLEVGMVTVDPERDTGKVLTGYLAHFFPGVTTHAYRTTDSRRLAGAERAFGASHELGEPDDEGAYDVSHTAQIYAVDPGGTVLVEWPFGTKPDAIAEDLRTLLDRT